MNYHFYGWENAVAQPLHKEYEKIKSPRELYDILSGLWCADTCAPRMRHEWTKENKTKGQCFLYRIFSGERYMEFPWRTEQCIAIMWQVAAVLI